MRAGRLIKELKKLPSDTEIVIWEWTGTGSRFHDLAPTLDPARHKGFFMMSRNVHCPISQKQILGGKFVCKPAKGSKRRIPKLKK